MNNPIKYYYLYIISTLFISVFGPMKYYNYNKSIVVIYIFVFLIFLYFGVFIGSKFRVKKSAKKHQKERHTQFMNFLRNCIWISLIGIFLEFIEIYINNPYAFSVTNMAANYIGMDREAEKTLISYSFPMLFRFFTSPLKSIAIIMGMFYWKELKSLEKKLWISFLVLFMVVNLIGYGTQKFLGDITIYSICIFFIKYRGHLLNNKIKIFFLITIPIVVFLILAYNQSMRYQLIGVTAENYYYRSEGYQYFNTKHIIFKIFGLEYGLGIAILLSSYLSGGYYGLSLSFQIPFKWTYGLGTSYIISKLVETIFGLRIYKDTYLNRMQENFGRDGLKTWNTIFPWIASDYTFLGALIIFIFIGFLWQRVWKESKIYKNPYSITLFCILTVGMIFVPANNQLLHGIDSLISTVSIFILWLFNHTKYNFKEI